APPSMCTLSLHDALPIYRVLGVLSAQSYRPEAYEDADLLSLGAIAVQAGIVIERVRATEQMALEHERHALQLEAVLATMNDALRSEEHTSGLQSRVDLVC